jgi:protein-S-isoprenylcysteine O-methyltransferase Ste14
MNLMMNVKHASIIGFIIAVLSMMILIYQKALFATGIVAITVQILAISLMIWARLTFGRRSFHAAANPTEGGLVTSGPYKFIRHPIYAALLYFIWVGVLSHLSIITFLLGVSATIGIAIRIFVEEHLIVKHYPDYITYAARTKRIIPFII